MSTVEYVTVWGLAGVAAVWFGSLAGKSVGRWYLWAAGGGIFGLVVVTAVWGVLHAEFIPMSTGAQAVFLLKTNLIAAALIAVVGWLFTLGRRRQNSHPAPGPGRQ